MNRISKITNVEFLKIWHSKICKISFVVLILYCMCFLLLNTKFQTYISDKEDKSLTWQEEIKNKNNMLDKFQMQNNEYTEFLGKEAIASQKAINEYRLENNIKPLNTFWDTAVMAINSSFKVLLVFSCIISINTLKGEYKNGTMKQILVKPFERSKVLLSKILGVFLFCILLFLSNVLTICIASRYLNPIGDFFEIFIGVFNGKIIAIQYSVYILIALLQYLLIILLSITICFTLSFIIQSKSFVIILSLTFFLLGDSISKVAIDIFPSAKYLFFNNLNLIEYFSYGRNNGLTFLQSLIAIIFNIVIMNLISIILFKKKEIFI